MGILNSRGTRGPGPHRKLLPALLGCVLPALVTGMEFGTTIPMHQKSANTWYVKGAIGGIGQVDMLVDTGASYLAIDEASLRTLLQQGLADHVKDLNGKLADGSRHRIPVYRISELTIGSNCQLRDIEAAVLPGTVRFILGLSALNQTSPFIFSTTPPMLVLSHCEQDTA
jgi:predicted aspartyl protease